MNKVDLPLKGLLIDKGELLSPGAKLVTAAKIEYANIEKQKLALSANWRNSVKQNLFNLNRDMREGGTILRWSLRKKYHKKTYKGRPTHVFFYWNKQASIDEINSYLLNNKDWPIVKEKMLEYEIARRNLTHRARIYRGIIKSAQEANYGMMANLSHYHVSQANQLIKTTEGV